MKLKECKIGTVVRTECLIDGKPDYGHIVGLALNAKSEVMAVIQWAVKAPNYNNIKYSTTMISLENILIVK